MKKIHIDLKENQKIFLTSDLHIGHGNILNFCNRPYESLKEMHEDIIVKWNSAVGPDDIVIELGDMFWWNSRHEVKKFISKLNGTIYIVAGNHDMDIKTLFELCPSEKVTILDDINQFFVSNTGISKVVEFWVSHFPLATWSHFEHAPSFFGHIHSGPLSGSQVDIPGQDLILKKNQIDVGADNWNYTPVELTVLLNLVNYGKKEG